MLPVKPEGTFTLFVDETIELYQYLYFTPVLQQQLFVPMGVNKSILLGYML